MKTYPMRALAILVLLCALPIESIHAGKSRAKGEANSLKSAGKTTGSVEEANEENNINSEVSSAVDTESAKYAAESTGNQNSMGMMMNGLIGAGLIKEGIPKTGSALPSRKIQGFVMIGLGLMALKQAVNQGNTAIDSYDVSGKIDDGLQGSNLEGNGNLTGMGGKNKGVSETGNAVVDSLVKNGGLSKTEATSLANQLSEASKQGFKIDPNTGEITLPNGKTVSPEQAMNAESFAAAGGTGLGPTKKAYEDMEKLADKVAGDLNGKMVAEMDVDSSGGGGGGSGLGFGAGGLGNNGDDSLGSFGAGSGKSAAGSAERKLAGMSKNYHGEPIGVSSNNIFTMMTRRYQLKQKQNFFLREDEAR